MKVIIGKLRAIWLYHMMSYSVSSGMAVSCQPVGGSSEELVEHTNFIVRTLS